MASSCETYFPRGPVNKLHLGSFRETVKRKHTEKPLELFKKKPSGKKKNNEPKRVRNEKKEVKKSNIRLNNVTLLRYETLQEGFLVVGCIKEIFSTQMTVILPGSSVAVVKINKISNPYCSLLTSYADGDVLPEDVPTLKELFKIGELVTCVVEEVFLTERKSHKVLLSLNPSDVNKDKTERILEENLVLVGAIKSKEDHGYEVDLGIEGVTAFLPFKWTNSYLKSQNIEHLSIGKIIRVCVKKVVRANVGVTTVQVTLEPDILSKAVPRSGFTVANLTPGQRMNVFIKQVVPNGIEVSPVHAFEDYSSYVHISYVPDTWGDTSGLLPGKVFSATFLYCLAPINILYFSLKTYSNDEKSLPKFQDGTIINDAKVVAIGERCVYLQLGPRNLNCRGFVSSKQFGSNSNFSLDQTLKARVLHYDFLGKIYICSLNEDIISAEIFSTKELQLGQTVKCIVAGYKEGSGLNLKLGTLNAFAPLRHLTDHPHRSLSTSLTSLYKTNSQVTAKVLGITDGNEVILTLKPTLLSSEALCQLEDAVVRKHYYGTVKRIIDTGIVVRFYGDLCGFVPNRMIASYVTGLSKQSFHEGQVIRCYVAFVNLVERKLILSLIPDAASDLKLGNYYNLEITQCRLNGLEVTIVDTPISGCIPFNQVTDHVDLLNCYKSNYSCGKVINGAVLYSFTEDITPLFSLRTSVKKFIQENPLLYSNKIPDLKSDFIVPCSVIKLEDSGIHLSVTLPGFKESYFIPQEDLSDDNLGVHNFKENQVVMAKVKSKDNSFEVNIGSANFINEVEVGVSIVEGYLSEAKEFQTVNVGERFKVKVLNVEDNTVNVKFFDKTLAGSFKKDLTSTNYKKNDIIKVSVLWQDPKTQHVYLHPDLKVNSGIPVNGKLREFSGCSEEAQVLLILEQLVVGVFLSGSFCGQLTFIPSKCHYNDFSRKKPTLMSTVRVVPCKLVNQLIVSEREKRIKMFLNHSGLTESQIISKLLGHNFTNKTKINDVNNKKKRRSKELGTDVELGIVKNNVNNYVTKNVGESHEDDENSFSNRKSLKKCKSKNIVSENEIIDLNATPESNKLSLDKNDDWKKVNGPHKLDQSISGEKKKRKMSESEDETKLNKNVSRIGGNTFEVSPVQIVGNKSKKKIEKIDNSEIYCNGNLSSQEIVQNEEICSKKIKRRKKSDLYEQEGNDMDSTSIVSVLNSSRKNSLSTSDTSHSENSSNGNISIKKNKRKKSICNSENQDDVLNQSSKIAKQSKNKIVNAKNSDSTDDEEQKTPSIDCASSERNENPKPRLSIPGYSGFCWNVNAKNFSGSFEDNQEDDVNSDDDDKGDEKPKRPKTAAEKKAAAKEAEKCLRLAEQQLLEAEINPQSVDHFERLTLAEPNNSLIWVKYMAHHLQAAEIDKARAVANRAFKIMSHREELERLNVWVALLNLENLYGTQESLKKTLDEAVRSNDEYQVYSKMAEIYADSNKNWELDQLTSLMVKKFKTDIECWLLCCRCLLKSGLSEKARSIFQRGLETLLRKEHVQYITRFASMENSFGSSEHAQTLMEHVLTTYPGRIPSWTIYVDMLTKSGRIDLARNVLERAVGQKLPVKKMKTLYKKWLQFEEQYGSEATVNHVRVAAENYVNSLNAAIVSV